MAGWIKMTLGMEVGLIPGDFVSDRDRAPLRQKGHNPRFSVHVYLPWNKLHCCTFTTTYMPTDILLNWQHILHELLSPILASFWGI